MRHDYAHDNQRELYVEHARGQILRRLRHPWLSQDDLEKLVAALQLESDSDTSKSDCSNAAREDANPLTKLRRVHIIRSNAGTGM